METVPAILLTLMTVNNRLTEAVKFYLAAEKLPFTPSKDVQRFLVLLSSLLIGIVSAYLMPNSIVWLGADFAQYPHAAAIVTGVAVSFGGAFLQPILAILDRLGHRVSASNATTYTSPDKLTTTIS